MRFASNSLYHTKSHTISRSVKHKNGLGSIPNRKEAEGMFSLHPGGQHESFLQCRQQFCVARTMLLCCVGILLNGCFLHLPFDIRLIAKFRIGVGPFCTWQGKCASQLVDYVQSHWHKSTNLSVCTRLQPQLLRQLEVRFTRAPGTRLGGLEMSRSLNLLSFESQCDKKALQIASWNAIHPNDKFAQASLSSNCCSEKNLILFCN